MRGRVMVTDLVVTVSWRIIMQLCIEADWMVMMDGNDVFKPN